MSRKRDMGAPPFAHSALTIRRAPTPRTIPAPLASNLVRAFEGR